MKYDIAIVGGGALGMAIAYRFAKSLKSSKIVVIDYAEGKAASRASGAMLGCFGEVTKYTFSHKAYVEKFDLMYAAHKVWPSWMEELEAITGKKIWHRPGTHIILNSQGGQLDEENFNAMLDSLRKYKEPFEEVNPRKIQGLDAHALSRPLRAIYINEGAVDSNQYLQVLRLACEKVGVEFINGTVTKVAITKGEYTLEGNFDKLTAEKVVLATGSYTSNLLRNSKLDVNTMPLLAGVGFAMVLRSEVGNSFKHTIRTANRSGSCGLHLVPYAGQREYIGATNVIFGSPQKEPGGGMVEFLTKCAVEQLKRSIFYSYVEEFRVGNRPIALDTFPLIGQTKLKGLFISTGTYRDGFHCSPIIAQNIVNEIMGKKRIISESFVPERKPIQTLSKADSIKEYTLQSLSGSYELWLNVPGPMGESELLGMFETKAKDIYKNLQTDIALNTDILFHLSMPTTNKNDWKNITSYLHKLK